MRNARINMPFWQRGAWSIYTADGSKGADDRYATKVRFDGQKEAGGQGETPPPKIGSNMS